jgi:hypothetical protein
LDVVSVDRISVWLVTSGFDIDNMIQSDTNSAVLATEYFYANGNGQFATK